MLRLRRLLASGALCAAAAFLFPGSTSAATSLAPRVTRSDVLVVGGTPAGVAAAIAAARAGERVTLASATGDLGGVLTGAGMDQWDLNVGPDGAPIEYGIFDAIHRRLGDAFDAGTAARALASLVAAEPRITVRYGERLAAVETARTAGDARIAELRFADARTGAVDAFAARSIVDATDSADVAALAGARYDIGRQDSGLDTREQAVTLMFSVAGVRWSRVLASYDAARFGGGGAGARRAWGYSRLVRTYVPGSREVLVRDLNLGAERDGTVTVNAVDVVGVNGLSVRALADATTLSQRESYRLVAWLRPRLPGFERARVAGFAPEVYVRETRHVAGLETLRARDVWGGRVPADSIGLSSYPLDLHPVDATDEPAFAPVRHVYGIPFGALVPRGIANLVLASPAISASHLASGSARVVPTTIEEGEADGAAAALAARDGVTLAGIAESPRETRRLRAALAADGVVVGEPSPGTVLLARRTPAVRERARRRAARRPA